MSNRFNKFKILTCTNNPFDDNNIVINRLLTKKPKSRGTLTKFFNNYNLNKDNSNSPRGKKMYKNGRKSLMMTSNNPSTVETSISNSIFDGSGNYKNQVNSKFMRKNSEINERKSVKPLLYFVPKHIENKLIFDIVFGHYYYLSKNKKDIKKLDKFILEMQKKFNRKVQRLYYTNRIESDENESSDESSTLRSQKDDNINNTIKYFEIQEKINYFSKLENLLALYSLIIFYLIKNQNIHKAKTVYLIMIKENINCINYLENLIDFKLLLTEKNNKNHLKIYQNAMKIQLKIYCFLIKYAYFLHISYYGNLFMKKYFNLSHKFYLYYINLYKMKNSSIDNENQVKQWFCNLNFISTYFSIYHYMPLNIPISLYNIILNIYKNLDDKYYELKDKNLLLCTLYNRSLLLYLNGQSDEAINSLKEVKKNIFLFIEDNFINEDKNIPLKNISYSSLLIDNDKRKSKYKKKNISPFKSFFKSIKKGRNLVKTFSNKNVLSSNFKKQILNTNKKFENYFLSNTPFDILSFINNYLKIYNIKIEGTDDKISTKATFNKKIRKHESSSSCRRSYLQLTDLDNIKQKKLPNILKSPLLIRTELLLSEIEIDRKNYSLAYTYINHSLAIISVFRTIKNIYYLNKYRREQKLIKEFLNIIDYSNVKNESIVSENREIISSEIDEYSNSSELFNKHYELNEKINVNKEILKELEKFFIFYATLSAYQIKILNDTQPTSEKRNYLPILFQNQFKDCLTIRQIIALGNLRVMALSRYVILKDPNKLILPNNLNINQIYFEKPELFSPRYFRLEKKLKIIEMKKQREMLHKKAYEIFLQILQSEKATIFTQNFLNNNYNSVMKIIENSSQLEINKMIENPNILVKPIEKFKKNNPKNEKEKRKYRHKSQICFSNKKILNKKLSLIDGNDVKISIYNKNSLAKKHLQTSNSSKLYDMVYGNPINRTCTSSENKIIFYSKNQIKDKNFNKIKQKNEFLDSSKSISFSLD